MNAVHGGEDGGDEGDAAVGVRQCQLLEGLQEGNEKARTSRKKKTNEVMVTSFEEREASRAGVPGCGRVWLTVLQIEFKP